MQIISQFAPLPLAQPEKGTAVAMGFFDGIHIGHRAVIESAVQWAKEHDAAPAVFTFKLPVVNKMKGKRWASCGTAMPVRWSAAKTLPLVPKRPATRSCCAPSALRWVWR